MKKPVIFCFAAVAAVAAATDYTTSFNAMIKGGEYERADSVLRLWQAEKPDDPKLYPARFNYLLGRAHASMLSLNGPGEAEEGNLVLVDSTGAEAGSIGVMSMWNDSVFALGIAEIDRGIKAYPWRLDFRLGRTAASAMHGDWLEVAGTMQEVLAMSKTGIGQWQWTGGEVLGDSAIVSVSEAVWDYIRDFYEADAELEKSLVFEDFGRSILDVFPSDKRVLNILGAYSNDVDNPQKALAYFKEASQADTTDAMPLGNMVYIYCQQGDTARALEICRKVAGSTSYDDSDKEEFAAMEADILAPVQKLEPYAYFFQWLPSVAARISVSDGASYLSAPWALNTRLPELNKLSSPFTDEQITAETVESEAGTVYVWRFPEPEMIPMCLFAAFVPRDGKYAYYTIEKSLEDYWVLGRMNEGAHSNYGNVPCPANASAFVGQLAKTGLLTADQSPAATIAPSR